MGSSILEVFVSIGSPKDKKNDDSVALQEVLEPHYVHKVDEKTDVGTDVGTDVDTDVDLNC